MAVVCKRVKWVNHQGRVPRSSFCDIKSCTLYIFSIFNAHQLLDHLTIYWTASLFLIFTLLLCRWSVFPVMEFRVLIVLVGRRRFQSLLLTSVHCYRTRSNKVSFAYFIISLVMFCTGSFRFSG